MSSVLVLVGFALLMALPVFLARRHVGESAARHILPGMSVALGAVITAGGAALPWVASRLPAFAALVVAIVILGTGLREWSGAVERVGEALSGSAVRTRR